MGAAVNEIDGEEQRTSECEDDERMRVLFFGKEMADAPAQSPGTCARRSSRNSVWTRRGSPRRQAEVR